MTCTSFFASSVCDRMTAREFLQLLSFLTSLIDVILLACLLFVPTSGTEWNSGIQFHNIRSKYSCPASLHHPHLRRSLQRENHVKLFTVRLTRHYQDPAHMLLSCRIGSLQGMGNQWRRKGLLKVHALGFWVLPLRYRDSGIVKCVVYR